jgi:hypothetical protein
LEVKKEDENWMVWRGCVHTNYNTLFCKSLAN